MPHVEPALFRELKSLPETMIGEILHGELVASRRLPPRVGYATMALSAALCRVCERYGRVLHRVEIHLDAEVLVPDFAACRRATVPGRWQ